MAVHRLIREQTVQLPLAEVFAFFADPYKLELLTPPFLRFQILEVSTPAVREGTVIDYRLRVHGLPLRWRAVIESFQPEVEFVDLQLRGPYALWRHRHQFFRVGSDRTAIRDTVEYALPFGVLGEVAHRLQVRRDLQRIFDFRQQALVRHLATR